MAKHTNHAKKIDYKEKMRETLQTILELQDLDEIRNWFSGIAHLMQFGRNYSTNNLLLVHAQKREAIWTEGFQAWKTKYRRFVQKGERGLLIFAPIPVKANQEDAGLEVHGDGEEDKEKRFVLFKPVYVWDYSQTRGDRVAVIETMLEKRNNAKRKLYATNGENLERLSAAMTALIEARGIEITHQDLGSAGGMARGKTIYIDQAFAAGADLGLLIHEFAHVILGHTDQKTDRIDAELEAELTVGLVKSGLGLDIQSQAAYLYNWSRDVNPGLREEKFLNAFKYSQPLASEILNHLNAAVAGEDEESDTVIAA
ncbi:MAG: ArdC-like ssDNA-binding domain-containing protein [Thermodesulfobacteriota bacterium]